MPLSTTIDPALRQRIVSLLDANRVVSFMKGEPPQCGFSAKAIGALNALDIATGSMTNAVAAW